MIRPDTLRRFSLFAEMEPAFVEQLASLSQDKMVDKREWLFHEGDPAEALYLIIRGRIELKVKLDEKRNLDATLTTLHEGDVLGWSAIVEPYIYSLGAFASDNTELAQLDGARLRTLLEQQPEQGYILMRNIAKAMGTRVNILSDRVPDLSSRSLVSMVLLVLGVLSGIVVVFIGLSAIISTLAGYTGTSQAIPVALFCLIFPIGFLILARITYPTGRHSSGPNDRGSPESRSVS